jgi:hypothetical protein
VKPDSAIRQQCPAISGEFSVRVAERYVLACDVAAGSRWLRGRTANAPALPCIATVRCIENLGFSVLGHGGLSADASLPWSQSMPCRRADDRRLACEISRRRAEPSPSPGEVRGREQRDTHRRSRNSGAYQHRGITHRKAGFPRSTNQHSPVGSTSMEGRRTATGSRCRRMVRAGSTLPEHRSGARRLLFETVISARQGLPPPRHHNLLSAHQSRIRPIRAP